MPDEIPGVNVPAVQPPAEQTGVAVPVEPPQQGNNVIDDPASHQPPLGPASSPEDMVDWKSQAFEWRRKAESLTDRLPQMIEEKLSKLAVPQQNQYTFEQLEIWKQQNSSDPNSVAWATGEQRKIQLAEQKKMIEEVVGTRDRVAREESDKQRALEFVQTNFPGAFRKDTNGRIIDWDATSPMTQIMFGLMRHPEFANNPQGLAAAAEIAHSRISRAQSPLLKQQTQQLKSEVKTLQKISLTEGAGRKTVVTQPPQQTALDNLRKTGSIRDAEAAVGAILRSKGIIAEG